MARETWDVNQRAIEALEVEPRDHILDVGCGHGRGLAMLAALAPKGRVTGADPSALMAEIAVKRNRKLVRARRVGVVIAGAESLPFPDATFDKAMCIHVVYFWTDLGAALREIARVLKPGGRLVLVLRTNANAAAVQAFPIDVYNFSTLEEIVTALEVAGFAVDLPSDASAAQHAGPILITAARQRLPELENAGVRP
ncbi:methyltransferase domain-containing protein [Sphingomonas sp. LB-2]|nr:methyltransferase domain-containing protein [Sphingomonas caeni]